MPKLYYCHGGLIKKTTLKKPNKKKNQKDPIKMVESKMICSEWHFGQIRHVTRSQPPL
jgi:hypothetical protein